MQGTEMYNLIKKLFPINRSLTGKGVRESLDIINKKIIHYDLDIKEVLSGKRVYDWIIPKEWNVKKAYIKDSKNKIVVNFENNNLHLMGYSKPINGKYKYSELIKHLYTLPDQPDAIPYVTSYYSENWGFSITYNDFIKLDKSETYYVLIDSELKEGSLTYADLIIPGKSSKEILFSTYICHPSMANNELSGPALMVSLINYISNLKERYYSYRFVIVPETIGSITYINLNLANLKKNIISGYNLTCVGDNLSYSFMPSRYGNTISDTIAKKVLSDMKIDYKSYSFLERGSDERQYCSPGVDLPVVSVMRSKYGEYEEYHTSLDNLDFVSKEGLQGSFNVYADIIFYLENNYFPIINTLCEPQLGKRGLYPNTSTKESGQEIRDIMNVITYCDGYNDILEISKITQLNFKEVISIINTIIKADSKLVNLRRTSIGA